MDITEQLKDENFSAIEKLIKTGKRVVFSKKQFSPMILHQIVQTQYLHVAKLLLSIYKPSLDFQYNLPIHLAILNKNKPMVDLLIKSNSKIFKENLDNQNAIDLSLQHAPFLLDSLKESTRVDSDGDSVLHYIIKRGKLTKEILDLYFTNKKNILNKLLQTPLHYAVLYRLDSLIVTELITKNNINTKDKYGNTPLHYAYANDIDSDTIVQILIDSGADISIRNKKKQIPLDMSRKQKLRRQTIFQNMNDNQLLQHLQSIKFYKGESGAKKINRALNNHMGNIQDIDQSVKYHINNIDDMMISVEKNDKRYKGFFYRGIRGDELKQIQKLYTSKTKKSLNIFTTHHYTSITSKKQVAEQFTNIQTNPDDSCCILVFKIPSHVKRVDFRELEKMNLLVNKNEKEILLNRGLQWKIKRKFLNKYYVDIV